MNELSFVLLATLFGWLVLYVGARLVSAAFFKSKQQYEVSDARFPKSNPWS